MQKSSSRSLHIDLIKVLACLMVVGLHSFYSKGTFLFRTAYLVCGFSIPAFFMSTGYFILRRKDADYAYAGKKALALIRLGLFWIVPEFCLVLCIRLLKKQGLAGYGLLSLPKAILKSFLHLGSLWESCWHLWYLAATALLYLLLPLLYRFFIKKKGGLILLWACLAGLSVTLQLVSYMAGEPLAAFFPETLRLWTWLQYLVLGALMPQIKDKAQEKLSLPVHGLICLALLSAALLVQNLMIFRFSFTDAAEFFYDDPVMILFVIALYSLLLRIPFPEPLTGPVTFLSPLTLGIYLVHPFVRKVYLASHHLTGARSQILCYLVLVLAGALISYALSRIPILQKLVRL